MKIKQAIQELKPYQVNDNDVEIRLNANETTNYLFKDGFFLDFDTSKYPDTLSNILRKSLSENYQLQQDNFVIGNGSTELLEIVVKTYTEKDDTVLSFSPTFSMYGIYAKIHGTTYQTVPLNSDMTLSMDDILAADKKYQPNIIFICNPNNPTGTIIHKKDIETLLSTTGALVVVDEAYMEFANETESLAKEINQYDNLIVARTFSKAYGLAGLRIGYMIANNNIISTLLKVKLPYSMNQASLEYGIAALNKSERVKSFVENLCVARDELYETMAQLPLTIYPSSTNFLYMKSHLMLDQLLLEKGILIRAFSNGYYRITVGNQNENKQLLKALKEVYNA
ncbi:MAG: histidinol-phosphate transaminase [Candidatus Izimaplasma sp.]|nr:histidinol-phosphate transaminase [Candidatus Izimaplasma bacterium]